MLGVKQAPAIDERADRTVAQVIRYYDTEASVYDAARYLTEQGRRTDRFHRRMLDLFFDRELKPGDHVVEIGCGTGRLLPHMASKGVALVGIDFSTGMLDKARQRLAAAGLSNVSLCNEDIRSASLAPRSLRAAYSIMVINLIPDYASAFTAVHRLLEPGGIFVFNVPYLAGLWGLGGLYVNVRRKSRTSNASGARYSHWFTKREILLALANSGFVLEEVRGMPVYVDRVQSARPLPDHSAALVLAKSLFIKARRG